jgi:hypothetical protein
LQLIFQRSHTGTRMLLPFERTNRAK